MELVGKLLISTLGCSLIIVGIIMKPIMEAVFPTVLAQQLQIVEGSMSYDTWKDVDIPVYMQFYTMSIGNPAEFLQGDPPYMIQKGPYTYREYRPKFDIEHNENFTVSYYQMKSYVYDAELSVGPDTETFTTLNVAVFAVAYWLRDLPRGIQEIWRRVHESSGAELLMERSINELMWGYDDPYLVLAQQILGNETIPSTKFGLFLNQNNSDDGLWTVFTGQDDIDKVAVIDKWNGMDHVTWWSTEWANMINGTDGSQRHPYVKKSEDLYQFLPIACRSGYARYDGESMVAGTKTYRFTAPPDMVASPEENPDNIGFCVPDNTSCPPGGLIDGSSCYFNAPVYLSMPHFLYGDEMLFDMVHGLTPDKDEHEIFFSVEPISGLSFDAHLRAQMSLYIQAYNYIEGTELIRDAYVPVVWLNETFKISEEYAALFKKNLNIATYTTLTVMLVCIVGGLAILVAVVITLIRDRKSTEEEEPFNKKVTESGHEVIKIFEAY